MNGDNPSATEDLDVDDSAADLLDGVDVSDPAEYLDTPGDDLPDDADVR